MSRLLSKKYSELEIGDCIFVDLYFFSGFFKITSIEDDELNAGFTKFVVDTRNGEMGATTKKNDKLNDYIRLAASVEEKKAALRKAIKYQDTL